MLTGLCLLYLLVWRVFTACGGLCGLCLLEFCVTVAGFVALFDCWFA